MVLLRKIGEWSDMESKRMCSQNTICEDTVVLKFLKCLCFTKYPGIKQLGTTEGRERA